MILLLPTPESPTRTILYAQSLRSKAHKCEIHSLASKERKTEREREGERAQVGSARLKWKASVLLGDRGLRILRSTSFGRPSTNAESYVAPGTICDAVAISVFLSYTARFFRWVCSGG